MFSPWAVIYVLLTATYTIMLYLLRRIFMFIVYSQKKTNPVRKQGEVRKAIPKSRLKAQQMQQGVEFINTPVRNHVDPTPVKSVQ